LQEAALRFVQWIVGLAIVGAAGAGTLWLLSPGETARLRKEREDLEKQRVALEQAVGRLTGEDRVAEVYVVDQIRAGQVVNGQPAPRDITTIEFIELDRQQHPLPSRRFMINDNVIFFDALVLKFDPQYVTLGDALRGRNLSLFRRIYGEHQNPVDGFPIDPSGDVPNVYRVNPQPSPFEQKLWSQFWDFAGNPDLAAGSGVHVAQGEAVYAPMERGQVWTLSLQNNGGLNLKLRRHNADADSRPSVSSPVGTPG
jgi:hypothetical protein